MGFFDFLKPKPQRPVLPPELEAKMKLMALAAFPGGPQQIENESAQLHALFRNKISLDEAKHILTRAKSLLVISEDKSEQRVVPSILVYSNGKLTQQDASLAYQFMTGVSGDLYSGGDGSTIENAVVIKATNSIAGIDAEYKWIGQRYGPRNQAWKVASRMHGSNQNGKSYETFDIECTNGKHVKIIFDVTAFYGRF
jgi:hypothetical protein